MKILLSIIAAVILLVLVLFVVVILTSPSKTGNQVNLQFFSFHPGTLTVSAGTTVTWTDKDFFAHHNVIGSTFASPELSRGDSYSYKFTQPGTYTYRCSHHRWMKGTVVVQ